MKWRVLVLWLRRCRDSLLFLKSTLSKRKKLVRLLPTAKLLPKLFKKSTDKNIFTTYYVINYLGLLDFSKSEKLVKKWLKRSFKKTLSFQLENFAKCIKYIHILKLMQGHNPISFATWRSWSSTSEVSRHLGSSLFLFGLVPCWRYWRSWCDSGWAWSGNAWNRIKKHIKTRSPVSSVFNKRNRLFSNFNIMKLQKMFELNQ